jgi:hypothetical protein
MLRSEMYLVFFSSFNRSEMKKTSQIRDLIDDISVYLDEKWTKWVAENWG